MNFWEKFPKLEPFSLGDFFCMSGHAKKMSFQYHAPLSEKLVGWGK